MRVLGARTIFDDNAEVIKECDARGLLALAICSRWESHGTHRSSQVFRDFREAVHSWNSRLTPRCFGKGISAAEGFGKGLRGVEPPGCFGKGMDGVFGKGLQVCFGKSCCAGSLEKGQGMSLEKDKGSALEKACMPTPLEKGDRIQEDRAQHGPESQSVEEKCALKSFFSRMLHTRFQQISSDFISFHQISSDFIRSDFIRFHQISSDPISSDFIRFHQISFHQISSDFIRFHQISSDFIRSDFIRFHQISSDFIRFHQISSDAINPLKGHPFWGVNGFQQLSGIKSW